MYENEPVPKTVRLFVIVKSPARLSVVLSRYVSDTELDKLVTVVAIDAELLVIVDAKEADVSLIVTNREEDSSVKSLAIDAELKVIVEANEADVLVKSLAIDAELNVMVSAKEADVSTLYL